MKSFMVVLVCVGILLPIVSSVTVTKRRKRISPCYKPKGCCSAGIPGIPGIPGAPGRDGRDGKGGGAQGGKQGPKGIDGVQGKQGPAGPAGPTGPVGPTGPKGDNGAAGATGPAGSASVNWKECSWKNLNDGRDHGLIKECIFQKKQSNSFLRVYFNGALRIYNCNGCCKRWFFTFNGAECKAPLAIDGVVYMNKGSGAHLQDLHRVRHIEGHCGKIHKGHVRVGFNVGNCAGYGSADAYTGWNSNSRLYVEEVPRPQA